MCAYADKSLERKVSEHGAIFADVGIIERNGLLEVSRRYILRKMLGRGECAIFKSTYPYARWKMFE